MLAVVTLSLLFAQKVHPPATSSSVIKSPPPPVVRGCDPNHFLTRAYQDLLGRPLDAGGSTYWMGVLKNGASRADVALQLMHNAESRARQVQSLYSSYLHRPAAGGDVAYFSGMLQQGSTIEQVEASILGSSEYFHARAGGTNQGFVAALYQDVLGRAVDQQGTAFFTQQLATGSTRTAVAQQVLTSPEARMRWINALYTKYLHHPGRSLLPGGQDQVAATIIGSEEYCRQ